MIPRRMPEFHAEMVEAFMASSNRMTGLPEFLGLRIVAMEPGGLTAEMTVDPKLLTGF
ncbi:MAG: phenylacetic acid degradation protein, partial [Caulobacter sp. 12-67-6]